jgi:hypothetical protein
MEGTTATIAGTNGASGALGHSLRQAGAAHGGTGLHLYHASYVDLVLSAESERGTVTLVAGSHTRNFPYFDTEPWDNCLLRIGDTGYTYTGRVTREALRFDFDPEQAAPRGAIRFSGEMRSARDGKLVAIELEVPIALVPLPTRLLGEAYNFLEVDGMLGLKWTPYELAGERGSLRVAGSALALDGVRGACERGVLTNLKAHDFAIKYEYVAVACPGTEGYGIINFTSHTLFQGGVLSDALDWYLRKSASAMLTIEPGKLTDGNPRGVYSPPQDDVAVALFENEVDLGPAVLRRQMIKTHDRDGRVLYGLREIFVAKPEPPRQRRFHFNRAQVNVLLLFLIVLDIVLSTLAIAFPNTWFHAMHGMDYVDPAGLLRRTGALWVAFVGLQAIALVRWQKQPYWLTLIAGVRFTELFSDWVTIFAAQKMTLAGTLGLAVSPPANLIFGLILIATYKRLQSGPIPIGSFFTRPWS